MRIAKLKSLKDIDGLSSVQACQSLQILLNDQRRQEFVVATAGNSGSFAFSPLSPAVLTESKREREGLPQPITLWLFNIAMENHHF